MKKLYIIEFNSANYCGASDHCLVWAKDEVDAEEIFGEIGYGENYYYEQDSEQYLEENGEDPDFYCNFVKAELVKGSDYESYVNDPSQACYYPLINEKI